MVLHDCGIVPCTAAAAMYLHMHQNLSNASLCMPCACISIHTKQLSDAFWRHRLTGPSSC